jgi:hypothetical protein
MKLLNAATASAKLDKHVDIVPRIAANVHHQFAEV